MRNHKPQQHNQNNTSLGISTTTTQQYQPHKLPLPQHTSIIQSTTQFHNGDTEEHPHHHQPRLWGCFCRDEHSRDEREIQPWRNHKLCVIVLGQSEPWPISRHIGTPSCRCLSEDLMIEAPSKVELGRLSETHAGHLSLKLVFFFCQHLGNCVFWSCWSWPHL